MTMSRVWVEEAFKGFQKSGRREKRNEVSFLKRVTTNNVLIWSIQTQSRFGKQ